MNSRRLILIALAVLAFSVQGCAQKPQAYKPKPALSKPAPKAGQKGIMPAKVYTCQDLRNAMIKYDRRTMIEAYKQSGVHDTKWDDAAVAFMERFIQLSSGDSTVPQVSELAQQAQRLVDMGCSDPLVRSVCGLTFLSNSERAKALPLLEQSLDELQKSGYCKYRAFLVAHYFRFALESMTEEKSDALKKLETKLLVDSQADDSFVPGEERIMLQSFESIYDKYDRPRMWAELRQAPKLNKYFYDLYEGRDEIDRAWKARGPGYAYQLKPEGAEGMSKHLEIARKLLTQAWKLHPEYPEAATEMIKVSMGEGGGKDTPRIWFDRAIAAQFDYVPAYDRYVDAITPDWGGSTDEIYHFGVECLETKRFDTEVPWQFFRALRSVTSNLSGDKRYWLRPETKAYLDELYGGYAKANPKIPNHYQTLRAITAWYLGDFVSAKRLLDGLGDNYSKEAFESNFGTTYEVVKCESDIRGGEFASDLTRLDDLLNEQKWSEALPLAKQVLAKAKDDKNVVEYINVAMPWIETAYGFSQGQWTRLTPSDDFRAWFKIGGEWVAEPDGTIVGTPVNGNMLELRNKTDFGKCFEIKGELEFGPKKQGERTAGIIIWHPSQPLLISFSRDRDALSIMEFAWREIGPVNSAGVQDKNEFTVQYWDGEISVYLNGKLLKKGFQADVFAAEKLRVGLGGRMGEGWGSVTYRNVQIRRLTQRP